MDTAPSKRVGSKYLLDARLGQNAAGEVHRASVEGSSDQVAVTILDTALAADDDVVVRFARERRQLVGFRHPNVVEIVDLVAEGESLAVVSRLVADDDLTDRLGQLPPEQVIDVGSALAAGLAAMHDLGIVHRNLRPGSVHLAPPSTEPRIAEFGLARLTERSTPSIHRAPEAAETGPALSAKADVFSLGVVLLELLDGPLATDGTSQLDLRDANGARPPLRVGTGPDSLSILLDDMTKLDPNARPALGEVVERLASVKADLQRSAPTMAMDEIFSEESVDLAFDEVPVAPVTVAPPPRSSTGSGGGRRSAVLAGGLAFGVSLLLVFAAWALLRDADGEATEVASQEVTETTQAPATTRPPPKVFPETAFVFELPTGSVAIPSEPATEEESRLALLLVDEVRREGGSLDAEQTNRLTNIEAISRGVLSLEDDKESCCGVINVVAYRADGQKMASGGDDGSIQLWDTVTGNNQKLVGHRNSVTSLAFSSDGTELFSTGGDGRLVVWDAESGERLRVHGDHGPDPGPDFFASARSLAVSSDASIVAVGSNNGVIRLWDAQNGDLLARLEGHESSVKAVAFSFNDKLIASASDDQTIRLWDAVTHEQVKVLGTEEKGTTGVAFEPSGWRLASSGTAGDIKIWDLASRTLIETLSDQTLKGANSVEFAPDGGNVLVSAHGDGVVRLWDMDNYTLLERLPGAEGSVWDASFSPDGRRIASAGDDGAIRTWDVGTGDMLGSPRSAHATTVWRIRQSPDQDSLATANDDGTIVVWNQATVLEVDRLRSHEGTALDVAFDPTSSRIATGGSDSALRIWDDGAQVAVLTDQQTWVWTLAYSPDGEFLITAGGNGSTFVRRGATGTKIRELEGHTDHVRHATFSPDGTLLATAAEDDTVRLWNTADWTLRFELAAHRRSLAVAFSSDSSLLATSGGDGFARVWDTASGREVAEFASRVGIERAANYGIDFTPDERLLAMSGTGGSITFFDLETSEIVSAVDFSSSILDIDFSPDGRTMYVGGRAGLRLYDVDLATAPICEIVDPDTVDDDELERFLSNDYRWQGC